MLSARFNRIFLIIPVAGIILSCLLYFHASTLYPGGTKLDSTTIGYSHLHNYTCDLLDTPSHSGHFNPGRPFARAATLILSLCLLFFWYFAPLLWSPGRNTTVVRIAGSASSLIGAFFVTTMFNYSYYHTTTINLAGAFFLIAFLAALMALLKNGRDLLFVLTAFSFSIALGNGFMWKFGLYPEVMPLVQKLSFITFFFWVGGVSFSLWRAPNISERIAGELPAVPLIFDVFVSLFALLGPFYMFGALFWLSLEGWVGYLFPWLAPLITFLLYKMGTTLRKRMNEPLHTERRGLIISVLSMIGTCYLVFMYFFFKMDLGDF